MAVRQVLRVGVKAGMQYGLTNTKDDTARMVGLLISSAYNIVSERADVRSWLTLPHDIQIMRIHLPEGIHRINLAHQPSGAFSDIDVSIKQNKITILRVIETGSVLYNSIILE